MLLLSLVSLIWAFSFGLIKGRLAGLDPGAVAAVRLALSAGLFLPFLRPGQIPRKTAVRLALIGAVEFGVMYMLYLRAYAYLQAYEVALFTIATPFYLALLETIAQRRWNTRLFAATLLAVAGASVVAWQSIASAPGKLVPGLLLIQSSNLCFALGQFFYRRVRTEIPGVSDYHLFGLLYLGALAVSLLWTIPTDSWQHFSPSSGQWFVLAYLGLIASGLCFFWWNLGATRVSTATLAVFNDAKIPLGVACSLLFFGESADLKRLLLGGVLLIGAIVLAEMKKR